MGERKIGALLDSLGVTLDISDTDMVTDVVVIAKNVLASGEVSITIGKSESTTWFDKQALIIIAGDIERQNEFEQREDGE